MLYIYRNNTCTRIFTWTAVSQVTVADRGLLVSSPISPMMFPEVKKSIRLALTCSPDPLTGLPS